MKIRIPTDAEYLKLCDITDENNAIMHWKQMYCWVDNSDKLPFSQPGCRAFRGYYSARRWNNFPASFRFVNVGFRPAVEGLDTDSLLPDKDGLVVLGTLYMDGNPVKVPQNPSMYGNIVDYIPGAALEIREPMGDPDYQVKGFILGDGVVIADRVLLKRISCEDIELAIKKGEGRLKIRIPKDMEYLKLCDVTDEDDALMHWDNMCCWLSDSGNCLPFNHIERRANRGFYSARLWHDYSASHRSVRVGFRPAVEGLNTGSLTPDEDGLVVLGTLYMNGNPVKVPQNPKWGGDITDYIPDATLEMREPLDDPDYQVKGFVVEDSVVVADRVLLKNISYEDIEQATKKE